MKGGTDERDIERLADIAASADKVLRWQQEDRRDDMYRAAVLRELAVIGEAANHLSPKLIAANAEIPWRSIIGLRNALVHEYWDTHWPLIEALIYDDLPALRRTVAAMMEVISAQHP